MLIITSAQHHQQQLAFAFRYIFIIIVLVKISPILCVSYLYDAYPAEGLQPPCSDYEMLVFNTKRCVSRCPIRCANGVCFEDGICPCAGSYLTSFTKGLICAADCLPGCKSAGGFCAAPDLCLCRKHKHKYNAVARKCFRSILRDRCRGRCLYGKCTTNGECVCAQGYVYRYTLLGQLCTPVCRQNCGRHGFCFLPDMCTCKKKHHHYDFDGICRKDILYLG